MKPAVWRVVALLCIAAAVAFVGYEQTLPQQDDFGLHLKTTIRSANLLEVTGVEPHSRAFAAGIRAGDTLTLRSHDVAEFARFLYGSPGTRVTVRVNGGRDVTLEARPQPRVRVPWGTTAIRLAFLLVAALLAWRRPEDRAARSLVVFLACYGTAIAIANGALPTPLLSFIVMDVGSLALFLFGTAAAASFAAAFPAGRERRIPGMFARIAFVLALLAFLSVVISLTRPQTAQTLRLFNGLFFGAFAVLALLVVATFVTAYAQGDIGERQRRRWVFVIMGIGLAGPIVDSAVSALFGFNFFVDQATLLTLAVLPIGLAYVILRHRVIDVGFVINRAIVYTLLSVIVVGIFVVVETLLGKYVESTSHVTSIAVQLAVALVLGFSIRYVHERVDGFVDRVLFRERHLAETALRTFSLEASYITDAGVLFSRCVKTVERYVKTRGAGIWVAAGASFRPAAHTFAIAPEVDENDPAILSMRARGVSVHVPDVESALPGALALPMIVRGELLGILICGPKVDEEAYDPDEENALASLASSVGHALDTIEIRELRSRVQALSATGGGQPAF